VRIASACATLVRLQFAQPVRTARGDFCERHTVLLELRDADGVCGYGEAAPWPGFGTETPAEACARLHEAESLFRNADHEPGDGAPRLAALLAAAPAARAAVQGALWDLAARRVGRPLAEHLAAGARRAGVEVLRRVPVSALLVARGPDALRAEAARAREQGHRAAKLKIGAAPLVDDLVRVRAAREGLGKGVRLRADANGAWSRDEALAAIEALAEFGLEYVEQPLPASDIDGLAGLRRRARVRVAADESVTTEAGVLNLLAADAVDVVVLKPAALGGPARALEIATRARHAGVDVVFSHAFESAVGAHHALHCAAAWGDPEAVHGLRTAGLFAADVAEPVDCVDGVAEVSRAPGLGIAP
jgi:o-succinylbenzoate synthase